jgi:putative DNA methylase
MKHRKKLIEVALPLEAINTASAREKSIRHGHPSTLHLWWARRPLAAARAVIFAQMVDDPASVPEEFPTPEAQERERRRLFRIIEQLVQWENTTNEEILRQAREEIWKSWRRACRDHADHPRAAELFNPDKLPAFHDPFAGGGALPLEAQRLGLQAYASDLNPVAVLINKAMIEIPPRFAGQPPVNPEARREKTLLAREWRGAQGLAEDVRYYGQWMRDEAEKRIGHLYPKIEVTPEMAADRPDLQPLIGQKLTVIAWLWARTVKSPNPAFAHVDVPLASTFMLSTKPGKEAYVEPVIENGGYRFTVKVGKPKDPEAAKNGTSAGKRAAFKCLMSGTPIPYDYIRDEGQAGRMGARLMAIVAEGPRGRVYLPPTPEHEAIAREAKPTWKPENELIGKCRDQLPLYGMNTFGDLFTPRQLEALTTFSDLVGEAMERVRRDALAAGLPDDGKPLRDGGTGAQAYAEAVGVYLALGVDRLADRSSTICGWDTGFTKIRNTFGRQAIPMTWDYAEGNPFSDSTGNFSALLEWVEKFLIEAPARPCGSSLQQDASSQSISADKIISTDPPYYDNIGYADLSDFFYVWLLLRLVWLRRSLRPVFPDLFATLAVPKAEELVATPYRHGSKEKAEQFFLDGMTQAMHRLAEQAHPAFPVTIYYAFKQSESETDEGTSSTGWETFLDALIRAGFAISGTWPMRTELSNRMVGMGTNALASSIVLVCRSRPADAPTATRREFVQALKAELPPALAELQKANIAPVDLAQAAIGPGMAVYTRYARVLDAEGRPVSVREALALINATLDEALAEQEGDFDADTRWAIAWFEQHGFGEGEFGVAETLSKAKNTSVEGMVEAGILESRRGKVRLLKPDELPADWDPQRDARPTVWEAVHHLVRALETGGERAAADLVRKLGSHAEMARELAYRLYTLCERKNRAAEALSYNALVQSWPEIVRLARESSMPRTAQATLFGGDEV